jgi:adenylyl-sulfate kinase
MNKNGTSHPGCVVWLTGLSGAGKSSIARELERALITLGERACILDGDKIRNGLSSDLTFSPQDREENVRRISQVAKLFAEAGNICIVAMISPYRDHRREARRVLPQGRFVEVYINAPVEICEQRDPKGLYARARAGEIKDFTGVSAPYEPPEKPEIELHTDQTTIADSVDKIMHYLMTSVGKNGK